MLSHEKKTVKSRCGVIQSWMLLMHSKVPWILVMPHTKHTTHSSGRQVMCGTARLQASTTAADAVSSVLLVKRNLVRKSIGK